MHYWKPHQKHSTSEKHYLLFGAVRVCFFDLEVERGGAPDGLPQPLGQEPSLPLTGIHIVLHRLPSAVMHCKPTKSDKVTIIIPGRNHHMYSYDFCEVLKLLRQSFETFVAKFGNFYNHFFSLRRITFFKNEFCSYRYTHYCIVFAFIDQNNLKETSVFYRR